VSSLTTTLSKWNAWGTAIAALALCHEDRTELLEGEELILYGTAPVHPRLLLALEHEPMRAAVCELIRGRRNVFGRWPVV
jgi:hypothetical protein